MFQKAKMIDDLIACGLNAVDEIVAKAVACTITKEEHLAPNRHTHVDDWERYRQAGITVIDACTGEEFNLRKNS